ncbi:hypothetical protein [Bacillus sp. FJAT-22090]|uniref:hypothetical protein n=1 Tax=Bacillus sp. FJAT-22090 TaxID=1581038 RepID=UPI0011A0EB62|nr:hypothetical protein [Bacillus sp. FJAT-22090]
MNVQPGYQLDEMLEIRTLKMNLKARITKRTFEGNYDTGKVVFFYDFIHVTHIDKPWSWSKVSEESLEDMIWEAKQAVVE